VDQPCRGVAETGAESQDRLKAEPSCTRTIRPVPVRPGLIKMSGSLAIRSDPSLVVCTTWTMIVPGRGLKVVVMPGARSATAAATTENPSHQPPPPRSSRGATKGSTVRTCGRLSPRRGDAVENPPQVPPTAPRGSARSSACTRRCGRY
jgi:hypothetical protein